MRDVTRNDLNLADCPDEVAEIGINATALLEKIDRIEAEHSDEIVSLREENRVLQMRVDGMREGLLSLMDKKATPGRETKERMNELLSALTRNGNRPIELASFEFQDGKLNKQQRARLVAHLRDDPLFKVPKRPVRRKLFVYLAGQPVKPR